MNLFDKFIPDPESYTGEGLRIIAGSTNIIGNSKPNHKLGYNSRPLKDGLARTLNYKRSILGCKT